MKKLSTIVVFLISLMSFSQTDSITNILNSALQNELRLQSEVMAEIDSTGTVIGYTKLADTIIVVKPFEIRDNVLSFTIQRNLDDSSYVIEKQDASLDKIVAINKDIGMLFETLSDAVIITSTSHHKDGSIVESTNTTDLFRTHCVSQRNNEYLKDDLIKAFKKAGYKIESSYWYD